MSQKEKDNIKNCSLKLDKITFKNSVRRFPIKISEDIIENVLSCLFYGFFSNIGIKTNDTQAKYLLKRNKSFNVSLYGCKTILNNFKENLITLFIMI